MLSLLEMSVTGGILVAAIVVIRALSIHRLPKKVFLVLWAVALGRLLLPFSIPSPASVYSAARQLGVTVRRPGVITGLAPAGAVAPQVPVALLVWAAGALVLAALFLVLHLRARRDYAASLPAEDGFVAAWMEAHRLRRPVRVRRSDQVDAPFTYGILWPVIVLPKALDWTDEKRLGFILTHELAHIRRFDALVKWVLAATLCLHWFNPLVWVLYVLANRDLELSCDETVVRQYGAAARAPYALTLVGLEEKRARLAPLTSSFSKNAMEERIAAIMKSKKTTLAGIAAALLLVIVVTTVFATSAPGGQPGPTASPSPSLQTPSPTEPPVAVLSNPPTWDGQWSEQPDPQTGHYYTQAQYDLVAALKTSGWEKQSIAEFNRTLNAKLNSGEDEILYDAYIRLMEGLPQDDPLAPFLYNTMQASVEEYGARLTEVYSGKRNDPAFRGSARYERHMDVYGDLVQVAYAQADYEFTYRILNQDKLTVADRDKFLQAVLTGVQTWTEGLDMRAQEDEEGLTAALEAEVARLGKAASNANIEYTGVEVGWVDVYTGG